MAAPLAERCVRRPLMGILKQHLVGEKGIFRNSSGRKYPHSFYGVLPVGQNNLAKLL